MVDIIKDGAVDDLADFDNRFLRRDSRFSVERKALTRLPLIDLSAFVENRDLAARRAVAQQLREACIDIGFFYLVGHGIPQSELDATVDWGHRFFDLPVAEKMKLHAGKSTERQGYMGVGGVNPAANVGKPLDLKERFYMSRDVLPGEPVEGRRSAGASQWPGPDMLPGFEDFMKAHIRKRFAVTLHLVRAFALSLDLPETYFDDMYRYLSVNFVLNYYPPVDENDLGRNQWSFSPHTDYGALTLLSQDALGGLQCRNSAGEWINVPPVPGSFVVNIGDLFATWTNDLYASTLHRALNTAKVARIAVPFFVSPHSATMVRCLDTCQSPGNPPRYEPVNAEEYVRALLDQANLTGRPGLAAKTVERFQARPSP